MCLRGMINGKEKLNYVSQICFMFFFSSILCFSSEMLEFYLYGPKRIIEMKPSEKFRGKLSLVELLITN